MNHKATNKTIVVTGATDGIGFEVAKQLSQKECNLIIHGRNIEKLEYVKSCLQNGKAKVFTYTADFSNLIDVRQMAHSITSEHPNIDVLINNAGVLKTSNANTTYGIDVRFVVNVIAPYVLCKYFSSFMSKGARVINLSSAAQASVNLNAIKGEGVALSAMDAYAQSKLAITMWSNYLAKFFKDQSVSIFSVNPGSLLGTKMVKEGFGMQGKDITIGSSILVKAALSDEFAYANGKYYDNDVAEFAYPNSDALDLQKNKALVDAIDYVIQKFNV